MVWNQRKMEFSIVYKAFSKLVGVGDAIDFIGETLFLCSGYCSKFDIVMTYLWFTLCCCYSFFCMLMNVLDCYLHDIDEVVVALVCWWIPYSSNTAFISATFGAMFCDKVCFISPEVLISRQTEFLFSYAVLTIEICTDCVMDQNKLEKLLIITPH